MKEESCPLDGEPEQSYCSIYETLKKSGDLNQCAFRSECASLRADKQRYGSQTSQGAGAAC